MSDDIIHLPPEAEGNPGEMRIVDGQRYIIHQYAEVGKEITLPSGRKVKPMRIFIDDCLTKLYRSAKGRDN